MEIWRMKAPVRFLKFCVIGTIGAGIQTAIFYVLTSWFSMPSLLMFRGLPMPWALGFAILGALCVTFTGNRMWTFRP